MEQLSIFLIAEKKSTKLEQIRTVTQVSILYAFSIQVFIAKTAFANKVYRPASYQQLYCGKKLYKKVIRCCGLYSIFYYIATDWKLFCLMKKVFDSIKDLRFELKKKSDGIPENDAIKKTINDYY